MNNLGKSLVVTMGLALAACSQPDHLKNDGYADPYSSTANTGITTSIIPGSANDPNSPLYFQQTIGDRVLFLVDQSNLTPEAMTTLDGQAQWLLSHAEYDVIIEGHADEQGTREYNLALGARRASSVLNYLLSKGVPNSRMRTVSYGKERPIEVCSEESCYARNRRAVTVISGGSIS